MQIFGFTDYKLFITERVRRLPNRGRGEFRRMATALRAHPSAMTQIFNGDRELDPEQALPLARYLRLGPDETRYLLLLVSFGRAQQRELREHYSAEIRRAQDDALSASSPFASGAHEKVREEVRATYYSAWHYSAVLQLLHLPKMRQPDFRARLAQRVGISNEEIERVLEFLLQVGLCEPGDDGIPRPSAPPLWVERGSPLSARHHVNWRLRGLDAIKSKGEPETFFSMPLTVSEADLGKVRELIDRFVRDLQIVVRPSPCESAACVNVDFFRF